MGPIAMERKSLLRTIQEQPKADYVIRGPQASASEPDHENVSVIRETLCRALPGINRLMES